MDKERKNILQIGFRYFCIAIWLFKIKRKKMIEIIQIFTKIEFKDADLDAVNCIFVR